MAATTISGKSIAYVDKKYLKIKLWNFFPRKGKYRFSGNLGHYLSLSVSFWKVALSQSFRHFLWNRLTARLYGASVTVTTLAQVTGCMVNDCRRCNTVTTTAMSQLNGFCTHPASKTVTTISNISM